MSGLRSERQSQDEFWAFMSRDKTFRRIRCGKSTEDSGGGAEALSLSTGNLGEKYMESESRRGAETARGLSLDDLIIDRETTRLRLFMRQEIRSNKGASCDDNESVGESAYEQARSPSQHQRSRFNFVEVPMFRRKETRGECSRRERGTFQNARHPKGVEPIIGGNERMQDGMKIPNLANQRRTFFSESLKRRV